MSTKNLFDFFNFLLKGNFEEYRTPDRLITEVLWTASLEKVIHPHSIYYQVDNKKSLWCALVDIGLLYFAFISVCFNICPLFFDLYTLLGKKKAKTVCSAYLNFVGLVLLEECFKRGVRTGKRKLCLFAQADFIPGILVHG